MGTCCSVGRDDTRILSCDGHHSLYVYPEDSFSDHICNVVYRPPYLNDRLVPGEAKPRFWINPNNISHNQAVVSVAWCQFCQPQHLNMSRWAIPKRLRMINSTTVDASTRQQIDDPGMEGSKHPHKQNTFIGADHSMSVKMYPAFLAPYVNKPVRIRLVFMDPKVEQLVGEYGHLKHSKDSEAEPMTETSHMIRNMHSLKLHLKYSSVVQGLPDVIVEENHGGVKRLKRVRYRSMPVNWIDLDHRKPQIKIVGEQFDLTLGPTSPSLKPEDFLDGNGEIPLILGTYVRALDTCPNRQLHFSARLFHWFNQSLSTECYGDISPNCPSLRDSGCSTEKELHLNKN